jgi:hypothetical protein
MTGNTTHDLLACSAAPLALERRQISLKASQLFHVERYSPNLHLVLRARVLRTTAQLSYTC